MRVNELRVGMEFNMPMGGTAICMAVPSIHPIYSTLVMVNWHYFDHPLGLEVSYDALAPFSDLLGDEPISMDPTDWARAVIKVLAKLRGQ